MSALNAARELPSTIEESLLLWLYKVSETVTQVFQQKNDLMLEVSLSTYSST